MVSTRSRTASKDSTPPATAPVPQKKRGAAEESASPRPAKKKPAAMASLTVGAQVAKDVTLRNQKDEDVTFADTYTDQGVVFFMYPRANTPGCTKQACGASPLPLGLILPVRPMPAV
jgi:peroxiredoxin Q/BCP